METVWKVGSRWGNNRGASLLRIFRRSGVVFIGNKKRNNQFKQNIHKGDYIAIADGTKVVAIARALDDAFWLREMKDPHNIIRVKDTDIFHYKKGVKESAEKAIFDYSFQDIVGVRVKIVDLEPSQQESYNQGTFHAITENKKELKERLIKYYQESESAQFNIESATYTLLHLNNDNRKKSILDSNTFYNIPIYQREYAWQEEQVGRFIRDIFEGYRNQEPMFIGTMQLSAPKFVADNEYEQDVIDGQQRLSTLLCLLKYIQLAYPSALNRYNLNFGWLETRVNNGKENERLQNLLIIQSEDDLLIADKEKRNRYIQNTLTIASIFDEINSDDEGHKQQMVDINAFLKYIFTSIYFVVIETHAGLSKTIRIFNTINTAGLDLNGDDLFKVRLFEYLKDCRQADDNAFNDISGFYSRIKTTNDDWIKAKHTTDLLSMHEIRTVYKEYLISKYHLVDKTYEMATDTFFDYLFDELLNVQSRTDELGANAKKVVMSLDDLTKVFEVVVKWNKHITDLTSFKSIDQYISWLMFGYSRYSRYRRIAYQVLLAYDDMTKAHNILSIVSRIAYCESIRYAKVTHYTITQIHELYKLIAKQGTGYDEVIQKAKEILTSNIQGIESSIGREIFEKGKCHRTWGNLICVLSECLEIVNSQPNCSAGEMNNILFADSFDFEHIHATNDKELVGIPDNLQNSIGNLMLLEYDINRSIGNLPFSEKCNRSDGKTCYQKSKYQTVAKIRNNFKEWGIEQIEERKKNEINKIAAFLRQPVE